MAHTGEWKKTTPNKFAQACDFQWFQRNPRLAAIKRDVEGCYDQAALSDGDLKLVTLLCQSMNQFPTQGIMPFNIVKP